MKINYIVKIWITRFLMGMIISVSILETCHAQFTVNPTANSSTNPPPVCEGSNIQLDAGVNGGIAPFNYSWTSVPAGLISSLQSPTDNPTVTTTYLVDVTDATSATVSGQVTVTVSALSPVSVSIGASSNPACSGSSVTFTATPVNGGSSPLYQWRVNGISSGGNNSTFTYNPSDNDIVTCRLTSSIACTTGSPATSNNITMTIIPTSTVGISISESLNSICAGTSVTFTATPTNGGTSPSYQWKVNNANVGTNSSTFSYNPANNDNITCVLTSNVQCPANNPATSNTIRMTVNPILPVSVSISPSANNICSGTSVTFTATPVNGGGSPSYQWKVNGVNSGGNSSTFSYIPLNGDVVTCVLTSNALCTTGNPATSPSVTMNVTSPLTPVVSIVAVPSGAICAGTSVTFTATPTDGGTPSYQWKINGVNAGTNSPSFTSATLINNDAVTVTMTSSLTCVTSSLANSNTITMAVNPLPVPTLISSDADNSFCTGTSVTFTASGGTNYDFRVGAASVQNGPNNIYTTTTLTTGQIVSVIVTNANGCSATSAGITNIVNPLPTATLTSSDADNIICQGTSVTFTAASGGANYNFMVGATSVQNGATRTYTTTALTNGQVVTVVVTNSNGCIATSSPGITNTVNQIPVPTLTSSDADNIFCAGTSVTFTASGGTNYNFRIGGISSQNGISPTFTRSNLTNGQVVDVVVSNPGGCTAISTGITNTVNPQPIANAGIGGNICGLVFKLNALPSAGVGTWTKTAGPGTATFSPNDHTAGATVTVSEYGSDTFTWTEVSGQCSSTSVVAVTFLLQPIANAGIGGNNCGMSFHLNGTMNAGTGTWAKVSGPGNVAFSPGTSTADAFVTVTAFGNYTFSWTVLNGTCSNISNVNVAFIQEISADGGSGGNECGKSFNLNAMVPVNGTGTWSKYRGPGNAIFSPDIHQPGVQVTIDQSGTYDFAWTVASGTCTSSDIVSVVFHAPPLINAGRDTAMCKGGSVQLKAVGIGSVSWTPVQLLSNSNIINPIASPDTTTKFTIHLTDQFGCKNADSLIVEVRNKVVADAGPDQLLNSVFSTKLAAKLAHNYERGVWSLISGTGVFRDSTNAITFVDGLSPGINKLFWTVTNGYCAPSGDTTNITVTEFVIPTLITPNMDGRNDYFIIGGLTNESKTELIIFDRRGVQVYKNLNYDNSWNGVDYNKNPLPDDTYFFVIKYADGKSYNGYLVIRR